ncbi:hypothetical protein BS50DRAFT_574348 [Corynespora cassiicola Philippines]|uniref:Uncharacterized protein n=1 Tax=Corynespora cassiicola Philippines TaxID=1448308 RepID=A0A2T2NK79_CORCC|nr:hypothetical protein BS50DRAFT_574348 [Corynespora cassiicola Philippines]
MSEASDSSPLSVISSSCWSGPTFSNSSSEFGSTERDADESSEVEDLLETRVLIECGIKQLFKKVSLPDNSHVSRPSKEKNLHDALRDHGQSKAVYSMISEGPWSSFNPKTLQTRCAICMAPFSGPNHESKAKYHIASVHPSFSGVFNGYGMSVQSTNLDSVDGKAPIRNSFDSITVNDRNINPKILPFTTIHNIQSRTMTCGQQLASKAQISFLLGRLKANARPEQVNGLFNGLDTILANLMERYPNDPTVKGIQNALVSLNQSYEISLGVQSTEKNQHTSAVSKNPDASCSPSGNQAWGSNSAQKHRNNSSPRNDSGQDSKTNHERMKLGADRKRKRTRNENKLFACPIRKHCEVHSLPPSCLFLGAANMWGVTQHLKQRVHREHIPFLALCRICWEHVIEPEEYDRIHKQGRCQQGAQPRGSRVTEHWKNLYEKIFPDSSRIPNPYVGDAEWTTKRVTRGAEMEHTMQVCGNSGAVYDFNNFPAEESFLGHGLSVIPLDEPPLEDAHHQFPSQDSIQQAAEIAALELFNQMLDENIQGTSQLTGFSLDQIVGTTAAMRPEDVDTFSDRFLTRAVELTRTLYPQDPKEELRETSHKGDLIEQAQWQNNMLDLINTPGWLQNLDVPPQPLGYVDPLHSIQFPRQDAILPRDQDCGGYLSGYFDLTSPIALQWGDGREPFVDSGRATTGAIPCL